MIRKSTLLAILAIFAFVQVSLQKSDVLPQKVMDFMGSRMMRMHHFLWHNLRENWLRLDASTQHAITKLGWAPPRPSLAYTSNGTTVVLEGNGSGEDFLYMHRQMVIKVNKMVADTDYQKIVGFKYLPYPGDPKHPVPPTYSTNFSKETDDLLIQAKSDDFFWNTIQPLDDKLWDPEYLKTISLATMGSLLEYGNHNNMHLRLSDPGTVGLRNVYTENPTPDIDPKWDNVNYQWLGDTYSSHVNPSFWLIHGWVDDHIEAWRIANGLSEVPWQFTWEEGPEATMTDLFAAGAVKDSDSDDDDDNDDNDDDDDDDADGVDDEMLKGMAKVVKIMLDLGKTGHMTHNATTSLSP